ncbi:hypothetical protein ACIBP6_38270 [Nonomuraea terrae]|uniref:hypothetical protein n=1 Tax=Nonomuraea terrae TaxID=2530383 RepID=UPI0037891F3F
MIAEGQNIGQGRRAALAALAFVVTALIIYALFSSGFGRPPRAPMETPPPAAVPAPSTTPSPDRPAAAGAAQPSPIAVVSDRLWLTYLPRGLERSGGGTIEPTPGAEGARARYGSATRFVEVQVEHGTVAADWDGFRERITVLDPRATTVRGKPAVVGRHPDGGRVLAWLERPGTGAWIRVSDSLSGELVRIAASVRAPVGD